MRTMTRVFGRWLPIALVATVVCGLVYAAVQQSLRRGADDPQMQLARDAADALGRDEPVESVVPAAGIDIGRSLAPFTMVFDRGGAAVATSGFLHGRVPVVPRGVLDRAGRNGEHRVTWQPERGVRIALVAVSYGGAKPGVVVAGRLLRETEARVGQLVTFTAAAWLACLIGSLILVGVYEAAAARGLCAQLRRLIAGPGSRAQ